MNNYYQWQIKHGCCAVAAKEAYRQMISLEAEVARLTALVPPWMLPQTSALPVGKDTRPKDAIKRGLSPSTVEQTMDFA